LINKLHAACVLHRAPNEGSGLVDWEVKTESCVHDVCPFLV